MLSEDSETGEGMKKRHKGALPEEDEDVESGSGKLKGRNQSWEEHDAAPSFSNEVSALMGNMEAWAKRRSCSCFVSVTLHWTPPPDLRASALSLCGFRSFERTVCAAEGCLQRLELDLFGRQQRGTGLQAGWSTAVLHQL